MADTASEPDEPPKKASKLPLILGLLLALVGGGGGFYATFSGLLMGGESHEEAAHEPQVEGLPDVAFVPVEPMIVSLTPGVTNQHLRFRANLEVPSQYQQDVTLLLPRVVDVLNGSNRYLRCSGGIPCPVSRTYTLTHWPDLITSTVSFWTLAPCIAAILLRARFNMT